MKVQSKKGQKIKSPRGGATIKESSLFLGSLVFGRIPDDPASVIYIDCVMCLTHESEYSEHGGICTLLFEMSKNCQKHIQKIGNKISMHK